MSTQLCSTSPATFRKKSPSQIRRDRIRQLQYNNGKTVTEETSTTTDSSTATPESARNLELEGTASRNVGLSQSFDSAIHLQSDSVYTQNSDLSPIHPLNESNRSTTVCEHKETHTDCLLSLDKHIYDDERNTDTPDSVTEATVSNDRTNSRSTTTLELSDIREAEADTGDSAAEDGHTPLSQLSVLSESNLLTEPGRRSGYKSESDSTDGSSTTDTRESEAEDTRIKKENTPIPEASSSSPISSLSKPEELECCRIDEERLLDLMRSAITEDMARWITEDKYNNDISRLMIDDRDQNLILVFTDHFMIEYNITTKMMVNFIVKDNEMDKSTYYDLRTRRTYKIIDQDSFQDETESIEKEYEEDVEGIISLLPHLKQKIRKLRSEGIFLSTSL